MCEEVVRKVMGFVEGERSVERWEMMRGRREEMAYFSAVM